MPQMYEQKGRLPACTLNAAILHALKAIITGGGVCQWQASVGTGGDLLGKDADRPQTLTQDWAELGNIIAKLPRLDSLILTAEYIDKGRITILIRNFVPAGAYLGVNGIDNEWVQRQFEAITNLFRRHHQPGINKLYSKIGFTLVQSVLPLLLAFIIVTVLAALVVPAAYRQSDFLWWITAVTVVLTLRLAATLSDKLILFVVKRYPYIKWQCDS